MLADRHPLSRRLRRLASRGAAGAADAEWRRLVAAIDASCERAAARRGRIPMPTHPPGLPVSERAAEIAAAIRDHPVVIVCGETGSGKTTQLPKICLGLGRGVHGTIGHTQPRRIAARTVAARIAQELGSSVGDLVGYKVRFTDHTSPTSLVKLMTDGILLAETQGDPYLSAYDTIIVDEAHERSLNIDFLLGYLAQLLPRRPDLKVVVTSATIDAARFSRHFGGAPVIEVSGRMHPVEVRYRPLASEEDDDEEELEEAIVDTVAELWREAPGDVLVFLPGEREIRETADLLRADLARRPWGRDAEVLPLFARLSVAEQQRVFAPSGGRRVVLATNVAETSLTVPGIRYVVDSGLARVNRYSVRSKVQLLQIEKVSRAAASQRAGRCGRVAAGVCVRLYAQQDFEERPEYTDPEILRSSLAAVILQMAALRLGPVEDFPFLEAPAPRAVNDGYQLLQELGAVDAARELTRIGRELARLPVDPRVGRMILAARDSGCMPEVLVIASALSVPDPRERPLDRQGAADQAHIRFRDERSDFLAFLNVWEFFQAALAERMSHRRLVDHCRAHFLSYLRLREWRDTHAQLVGQIDELGWRPDEYRAAPVDARRYEAIHRALLTGLLGGIGCRGEGADVRDEHYLGPRGIRFHLHPSSGLARRAAKWVVAAELTETTRLFARCVARVEPEWIEQVAGERVTRDYFEARWDPTAGRHGEVVASERVTLYGLTLVPRRRVAFAPIDPVAAREVFIREALAAGAYATSAPFLAHNRRLLAEIAELEHKARRQDLLVDEEAIAAFYAERLPVEVVSGQTFEEWRQRVERTDPKRLFMTREGLMRHAAREVTEEQFPEWLVVAGNRLPLKYRFAPGHPLDGLTLAVPLALLNQVDEAQLSWLVPGLIREKVTACVKALPKPLRNRLVPLADFVTAFLTEHGPGRQSLHDALRASIGQHLGTRLAADVWDAVELPAHLHVNVRVVDDAGRELAAGRDLHTLREQLGNAAQLTFGAADPGLERSGIVQWDFGDLPEKITFTRKGQRLTGYPALVDEAGAVAIRLLDTPEAALRAHRAGVVRLLRQQLREPLRTWERPSPAFNQAALQLRSLGSAQALLGDLAAAIADRAFLGDDSLPRTAKDFEQQRTRARARLPAVGDGALRLFTAIAAEHHALSRRIASLPAALARVGAEAARQRDELVYPGFLCATPWERLAHLPRYLQGLQRRLQKCTENPERDARQGAGVAAWWARYAERRDADRKAGRRDPALEEFRWMLEELRVSLFAQELRTPHPVSYKRVEKAWHDIVAGR
jgi:ATP-dependent helicase HrpA